MQNYWEFIGPLKTTFSFCREVGSDKVSLTPRHWWIMLTAGKSAVSVKVWCKPIPFVSALFCKSLSWCLSWRWRNNIISTGTTTDPEIRRCWAFNDRITDQSPKLPSHGLYLSGDNSCFEQRPEELTEEIPEELPEGGGRHRRDTDTTTAPWHKKFLVRQG